MPLPGKDPGTADKRIMLLCDVLCIRVYVYTSVRVYYINDFQYISYIIYLYTNLYF